MALDNTITISGNITRDPELRFTATGHPVANLSVAVNRRWRNQQTNEWEETVTFIDVTAWGDLAENTATTLTKGTRIIVNGRLDQHRWETNEGETRTRHQITADDIAPSLKWATAKIIRTHRDRPNNSDQPNTNTSGSGGEGDRRTVPNEEPF